jgi:cbb3-type cytochrome oxidase subunit 3
MLVFIGVIIYAFKLNKKSVDYYSNLPLDDKENNKINLE